MYKQQPVGDEVDGQEQQEAAAGDRPGLATRRGLDCTLPSEQSTDQTNSAFYFRKLDKKYKTNTLALREEAREVEVGCS